MLSTFTGFFIFIFAFLPPLAFSEADSFEEALNEIEQTRSRETKYKIGLRSGLISNSRLGTSFNHAFILEVEVVKDMSLGVRPDYSVVAKKALMLTDLSVSGFAKYSFNPSAARLTPYLTAGIAKHYFSFENNLGSGSFTLLGLDLGGGVSYEIATDLVVDCSLDLVMVSGLTSSRFGLGITKSF